MNIPILLLIYNRPAQTRKVFEVLRQIKPKYLFVSADGKNEGKCLLTRNEIKPDWDCELKTNFGNSKLGCKYGVIKGIDWFFKHVEYGIILEDDVLPSLDFFPFMEKMLEKFKVTPGNHKKIYAISGCSFNNDGWKELEYKITKEFHFWGWGTWANRWADWQEIGDYENISAQELVEYGIYFEKCKNGYDTWDFQLVYSILKNDGYVVSSTKNMIKNIGFGLNATHTKNPFSKLNNLKYE